MLDQSVARGQSLHVVEREAHGFTHADIGAYLLALWGLPPDVVEAVGLHHTPLSQGVREQPTARQAARMAHLLVQRHRPRTQDPVERLDAHRSAAELAAAVAPNVLHQWMSATTASSSDRNIDAGGGDEVASETPGQDMVEEALS